MYGWNKIEEDDMEYICRALKCELFAGETLLITGATGFFGLSLIKFLIYLNEYVLEKKCKIIALCRNEKKAIKEFKKYSRLKEFFFVIHDIENRINDIGHVDYILHAACNSSSRACYENPIDIIKANVVGTMNLLAYATKEKIKGFLFFSSGAVYGNTAHAKASVNEFESYPLAFLDTKNSYAESKRMAENICRAYFKQYDIPVKIIRISHTYGPGIDLNDGHIYSDIVKSIINRENLVMNSYGEAWRPFCYISDAVIACFKILFEGENGEAYNMANMSCYLSIHDLISILFDEVFSEKNLKVIYPIGKAGNLIKEMPPNVEKIKGLGWQPQVDVRTGFKRTVNYYETI